MADVSLDDLIKKDREQGKGSRLKQVSHSSCRSCMAKSSQIAKGDKEIIVIKTEYPAVTNSSSTNQSRNDSMKIKEGTTGVLVTRAKARIELSLVLRRKKGLRVRRRYSGQ